MVLEPFAKCACRFWQLSLCHVAKIPANLATGPPFLKFAPVAASRHAAEARENAGGSGTRTDPVSRMESGLPMSSEDSSHANRAGSGGQPTPAHPDAERGFAVHTKTGKAAGLEWLVEEAEGAYDPGRGLGEALSSFLPRVATFFRAEFASVMRFDSERMELRFEYAMGAPMDVFREIRLAYGEGIGGAVAMARRPTRIANLATYGRHFKGVDERTGTETRNVLAVPLIWGGEVWGVMEVGNRDPAHGEFTDDHLAQAHAIGAIVAGWMVPEPGQSAADRSRPATTPVPRNSLIVGTHPSICTILNVISQVAPTDDPVLILGETGTGKELVAQRIHNQSRRYGRPFVVINCAAIAETLMESELFGHRKGAFTDAREDRPGSFVLADGGTLFLDEIADLAPSCQAKLLRALDEGEITPVGGSSSRHVDVRVVAATNQDLTEAVRRGRFRRDLYYRLRGFELELPPLRDRRDDIPLLCEYFVRRAAAKKGKRIAGIEPEVVDRLRDHDWPGNVRELRHLAEAMVTLAEGEWIGPENFPPFARELLTTKGAEGAQIPADEADGGDNSQESKAAERTKILDVLERTAFPTTGRWNVSKAARELGLPRKTLEYKIRNVYRLTER